MDVGFTYDWISATMSLSDGVLFLSRDIFGMRVDGSKAIARHGYTRAAAWESGVVAMWNENQERMGFHIVMSGSALRWMADRGTHPQYWIDGFHDIGARLSRVDLAIDIKNSSLTSTNFSEERLKPYKGRGRTPKFTTVLGGDKSWTVYVGSRTSEKFLRIYDKAKEQGNYEEKFVRIEIECKGSVAHWLGEALFEADTVGAKKFASTLIREMADFEGEDWANALEAETVELAIPKPTERDTIKWLLDTAAPSLARMIKEKPSEAVLEKFLRAVADSTHWSLGELLTGNFDRD